MSVTLDSRYDPKGVEGDLYRFWEERGIFHEEPDPARQPYSVCFPPPNVTGALHMGHALNGTLQDVLGRFRRMQGRNTLLLPGIDHAGIATQNVVERELKKTRRVTRDQLGREAFLEEVWAWKRQYGGRIVEQLRRLGASFDWKRERFTMDEGASRAVFTAFETLYRRGLIYRGKYIINWCPRCRTALSDEEAEHREVDGKLWKIRYPVPSRPEAVLVVATTRPETLLGDTAVAVHPEDERYRSLVGLQARLPIVGRMIPVIADAAIDRGFGTGALKVTPAHDTNDFHLGLRHELARVDVMNPDGTMSAEAGEFAGLDRFVARERVVERLERDGLLVESVPHRHSVQHCYRCNTVIEPRVSDQWFVKMKPLAEKALRASDEGRVRFFPERWEKVYRSWLENVRDWCISRQIWWGHRIPAWWCEKCRTPNVSPAAPSRCASCGHAALAQDEDVLDTWFSSALWPFSTLGWPDETADLRQFYPTSTLSTAREIIYFWVARMVMMGLEFRDEVPFADVLIHGTVLDEQGRRMSKSLGNGIDPVEMIDRYGADAVRLSLILLTVEGQDTKLSENRFEMGRNFANKLWNAARFTLMNLEGGLREVPDLERRLRFEDRWIRSRLHSTVRAVAEALETYRLNEGARLLYEFTWGSFCDWYVEMVKPRLKDPGDDGAVARLVLGRTLETLLRLLHPYVPFVTEKLWREMGSTTGGFLAKGPCLAVERWPAADPSLVDPALEEEVAFLQEVVARVRNIRANSNIPDSTPVDLMLSVPDEARARALRAREEFLRTSARLRSLTAGVALPRPSFAGVDVVQGVDLYVPLEGLIDMAAERTRLEKKLERVRNDLAAVGRKLADEKFTGRAPAEVIERERKRREELAAEELKIVESLQAIGS